MKKRSKKLPRFVQLADKAIKIAIIKVIAEHKLKRLPLFIWQENKIVRIPHDQISTR
jgi:hypothetical protein